MTDSDFIVKLKGLPWSAQEKEIQEFFQDCKILNIHTAATKRMNDGENNITNDSGEGEDEDVHELSLAIHLVSLQDGRSSGEAFVEFESAEDVDKAMLMNKKHLGTRYVDIYKVKRQEMEYVMGHHSNNPSNQHPSNGYYGSLGSNKKVPIVKLKGVPYDCSKEEISNFLPGLEIVPNGISIMQDQYGRCNGEVFVHFVHQESLPEALKKHKKLIGHRYIEVFESSCDELMFGLNRSQQLKQQQQQFPNNNNYSYNGGGGGGGGYYKAPYGNRNYYEGGGGYDGGRGGYRGGSQRGGYHNVAPNYNNDHYNNYRGNQNRGGFYPSNHLAPRFTNGQSFGRMDQSNKRPFIGGYINRTSMHHSSTGHTLQMRGLPFSVTEDDIRKFFTPLEVTLIHIQRTPNGKATGIAHVDFENLADAQEALKKDKQHIDDRYIDLYLKSFSNKQANRNNEENTDNST